MSTAPVGAMLESQQEIWIAQQLRPESAEFNCAGYLDIRGPLDTACFAAAFDAAAAEVPHLWCTVQANDGSPSLVPHSPPSLTQVDLARATDAEHEALRLMRTSVETAGDLAREVPVRMTLHRLGEERHLFFTQYHHLLMDGYGQILFWNRIAELYRAIRDGAESAPARSASHEVLRSDEAELHPEFDRNAEILCSQMAGRRWSLTLPPGSAGTPGTVRFDATAQAGPTDACADQHGARWSTVVIALLASYLRRVSDSDEIVVGFPTRGRHTPAQRSTPTMLSNEVPLFLKISPTDTFGEVLQHVSEQVALLLGHQKVRGAEILRRVRHQGEPAQRPNVVLNVMSFSTSLDFGEATGHVEQISTGPVRELSIDAYRLDDQIRIALASDGTTLGHADISLHGQRIAHLFATAGSIEPTLPVAELDILPSAELEMLEELNDTTRTMPVPQAITSVIAETAQVRGDAVALSGHGGTMTYRQMSDTMRSVADHLREAGVETGSVVAVHMTRSTAQVCAALAVLAANAVYLPLDPTGPPARRDHILRDSQPAVIITDRPAEFDRPPGCRVVLYDELRESPSLSPTGPGHFSGDDPAYLIYTSGSTGLPKGVLVSHRALWNRLQWMKDDYEVTAEDVYLQKTNPTFDVAMWELLLPLMTGARLHSLRSGDERDPRVLTAVMETERVTVAHFVPTMLDAFLHDGPQASALRLVFSSGEALRSTTVRRFLECLPGCTLHNLYGPTEAAIDVTAWQCGQREADSGVVPIGKPVANTRVGVVDENLRTVPIGVPGELCILGVQLAQGYMNRPDLTAERFVTGGDLAERAYRTGDVVRWTGDGVLEFLGRDDGQVKIRGFRVELGEVEAQIRRIAEALDVVVTVGSASADEQLTAVVIGAAKPLATIRRDLSELLPDYMIPARWHTLDDIPLLPNGKRDLGAVRALVDAASGEASPGPADSDESPVEVLRRGFEDVLNVATVARDDDFFVLGGDSMRAIRLRSFLEKHGGHTFAIEDLYASPTPAALASCLQAKQSGTSTVPFDLVSDADRALVPDDVEDAYPLTSMQQGILYQYAKDHESTVYRVVTSVTVPCAFDLTKLVASCEEVLGRHPQLRTTVDLTTFTEPLQLVHRRIDVRIEEQEDLTGAPSTSADHVLDAFLEGARNTDFDLGTGPLIRFAVHRLAADRFQLTAIEHHVALDGWSDVLLFEEILTAYAGLPLEPAPQTTYRDHVAWERTRTDHGDSLAFWAEHLQGVRLPELFGRRAPDDADVRSSVARFPIVVPEPLHERLTELASRLKVSLKTVLVASHVLAVSVASGTDEVVTGVIANARPETADADTMIGVFLNTLPLRMSVDSSLAELLVGIHQWEVGAAPHRMFPFGHMERELRGDVRLGDLQTYVNFMDFRRSEYGRSPIVLSGVRAFADTNYPAAVDFMLSDDEVGLTGWIDGNLDVFSASELTRLAALHERSLEALADLTEDTAIGSIDLTEGEFTVASGPAFAIESGASIHQLIADQARHRGNAPAVSHRDDTWTFAELAQWTDRYAEALRRSGVGAADPVAIHLTRGPHLVAAILGIHHVGAHYVPLDPDYPSERLSSIVADAAPRITITDGVGRPDFLARRPTLRPEDVAEVENAPVSAADVDRDALAYVIYTSGSTGTPKGVTISHGNLMNFVRAMDLAVGCDEDDVMLAATSLSFDISVLELLWPLCSGAHVVIADHMIAQHIDASDQPTSRRSPLAASLFFFAAGASDAEAAADGYRLLLDASRFADSHDFSAVWTPERHFHDFGGLYPNPALTSAALATITSRIHLRSGSVVAPLHDPLRMAEEWAAVDQLSGGRVGLAFASGWNSNDFALAPAHFDERKAVLADRIDEFTRLWEGKPLDREGGSGEQVGLRTYPRPVQGLPPMWLTSVGSPETFIDAGRRGFNVLTHLFGQDLDTLRERIDAYRRARSEAGYVDPGTVTLMLHTFLDVDDEHARSTARAPFKEYLRRSTELWRAMFASTGQEFPQEHAEEYLDAVLDVAVERYFDIAGLFGSPESRLDLLHRVRDTGVDEIAALIDFGIPHDATMTGLSRLAELMARHRDEIGRAGHSLTDLCRRHGVTMFQATPSVMATIARDDAGMSAMGGLRTLLVGGEQFPPGLALDLVERLPATRVFNMYGPTETTIWSTVEEVRRVEQDGAICVGRPVANTTVTVLDPLQRPVPTGVVGELWIAGDGVSPGYLGRADLTAERFRDLDGVRFYGTGDLARFTRSGKLQIRGRIDRQVKVHGQRVELDEIEGAISLHPDVAEAAVTVSGSELVAYVLPGGALEQDENTIHAWSSLWDNAYAEEIDNPYAGWISSYTGRPLAADEMDEWLAATMAKIAALPHRRVLEIGTGSGLIRGALGSSPDSYLGIDTSSQAIDRARRTTTPGVDVDLRVGELSVLDHEEHCFDLVVLNSVAQYFPSTDYLTAVLDRAVELTDTGSVFVGDVRSFRDLGAFYLDLELARGSSLDTVDEVRRRIQQRELRETELCIAPDFFHEWAAGHDGVTADVTVKRTDSSNEMSSYRYDVVIGRSAVQPTADVRTLEWSDLASVGRALDQDPGQVSVLGVPNPKLVRAHRLSVALDSMAPGETVWELERVTWPQLWHDAPTVTQIADLASTRDRRVELRPHANSLVDLDVHFSRREGDGDD